MQMEMVLEGGDALRAQRSKARGARSRRPALRQQLSFAFPGEGQAPIPPLAAAHDEAAAVATGPPGCTASARAERGRRGYLAGLAAEDSVARHYARIGRTIAARRWRGPGGEIDLILREGARLVFVEVKASRSFDAAIARLTRRQIDRIRRSAEAYCATAPDGLLTEMRFDLALVDGRGMVRVVEAAFDDG